MDIKSLHYAACLFSYVVNASDVDGEGGRPGCGGLLSQSGADWLAPPSPQACKTPQ